MTEELVKKEDAVVTNDEASLAMKALGIHANIEDIRNYKNIGSWLIAQDIPAVKLAQTFDSDEQIKLAIEVSRDLANHEDPEIKAKGVQGLLSAVKARAQVANQSMKLAEAAGAGPNKRGRNLPPTFNGAIYLNVTPAPTPEQTAKSVDI